MCAGRRCHIAYRLTSAQEMTFAVRSGDPDRTAGTLRRRPDPLSFQGTQHGAVAPHRVVGAPAKTAWRQYRKFADVLAGMVARTPM